MKQTLFFTLVMLLSACSILNPYVEFYRGEQDARTFPGYQPSAEPLQVYSTDDFDRDISRLNVKGYVEIGRTAFDSTRYVLSEIQLREQADRVGAQVALVSPAYLHSVSGLMPLSASQDGSSSLSEGVVAATSGGMLNAQGNGKAKTPGTDSTITNRLATQSNLGAVFMVKVKMMLGVFVEPLNDETRKRLETNYGVRVKVVATESPANFAGIVPGDVILAMGQDDVQSVEYFIKTLLPKYADKTVVIELDRNGTTIEKEVHLNSLGLH